MKLYTKMPRSLKPFYLNELNNYNSNLDKGDLRAAWRCLERAHILGQPYPISHTYIHWKMLKFGFIIKDIKEIFGQIPRLLIGGIKSFVGKIPVGNTGGANVPPLKPMPIPGDLLKIIQTAQSFKKSK